MTAEVFFDYLQRTGSLDAIGPANLVPSIDEAVSIST